MQPIIVAAVVRLSMSHCHAHTQSSPEEWQSDGGGDITDSDALMSLSIFL